MTARLPKAQQASHTRAAILDAARRRFAELGYDGTTIRAVAADAAIDASMVMRYFTNKAGLFAAAADINLYLPDISRVPRHQLGVTVARHFLNRWEDEDSGFSLRVLLSSSLTEGAAAEKMAEIFHSQLEPVVASTSPVSDNEASERAGLIASQILGFALCRYVLQLPPLVLMDHESIIAWLGPTIQRYLDAEPPQKRESETGGPE